MKKIGILMLFIFVLSLLSVGIANAVVTGTCSVVCTDGSFGSCDDIKTGEGFTVGFECFNNCNSFGSIDATDACEINNPSSVDKISIECSGVHDLLSSTQDSDTLRLTCSTCENLLDDSGEQCDPTATNECTSPNICGPKTAGAAACQCVNPEVIPEFSTFGIIAAIVAIGLGTAFIMRRRKK